MFVGAVYVVVVYAADAIPEPLFEEPSLVDELSRNYFEKPAVTARVVADPMSAGTDAGVALAGPRTIAAATVLQQVRCCSGAGRFSTVLLKLLLCIPQSGGLTRGASATINLGARQDSICILNRWRDAVLLGLAQGEQAGGPDICHLALAFISLCMALMSLGSIQHSTRWFASQQQVCT
ncbi:hypothetical protein MLD38_005473 [Melastoma candidum]|uniref:Uncharacterized protein n=1 Tax=Melastoma candidum TaxID=119954 RepID=A0ACB9RJU7_9MYRT|nr:hypothetical protein MLD38_005473 [Melastoma candidum]